MITSVKSVLSKYAVFRGRAGRSEYWYWVLAILIANIIVFIIEGTVVAPLLGFEPFAPEAGQPLRLLLSLATILPSLAVTVRRLHDIGRSGWWIFVQLLPIIGSLVLLWWLTRPTDPQENEHGSPP
jgi:uncharacterized membrane protein YhaH (DUF805 family)